MRIAVTGAEGRVGGRVVRELLNYGHQVVAVSFQPWLESPTENRCADIRNYEELKLAFKGCDAVVHLAGIPHPMPGRDTEVFQTNTTGVFNACLAAGNLGIRKVVIASSDCAIGITFSHQNTRPSYLPMDEQHPASPDNCYGMSKLVGEQIAEGMAKRFQMSVISLRISAVLDTETYKADWFRRDLVDPTRGVTDNLWTYIDARDCARAFRLAVEADIPGHEVIHIASSDTRASVPTAELLAKYFPEIRPKRPVEGFDCVHDLAKAERLLGFRSSYTWRDEELQ